MKGLLSIYPIIKFVCFGLRGLFAHVQITRADNRIAFFMTLAYYFYLVSFLPPAPPPLQQIKTKPLARNFTFTARSQRRFKSGDMAVARFHDRRKFLLGHKWPPNNSDIASRNPFEKTPLSNLPIYQLLLLQRRNCKCWTLETLLSVMTATLGFQTDHTVGNVFTRLENDIDIGSRATEMCPNKNDMDIWLSALEKL